MIPGLCSLLYRRPGGSGGFSVTAAPASVANSGRGPTSSPATTATPIGGSAPYTYSWDRVSGAGLIIAGPAAATTVFIADLSPGEFLVESFQCTVTDSTLATAISNIVTATLSYA